MESKRSSMPELMMIKSNNLEPYSDHLNMQASLSKYGYGLSS